MLGQFMCKQGHPVEQPRIIRNKLTGNFFVGLQCDKCDTDYAMTDETESPVVAMMHLKHLLEEVQQLEATIKERIEREQHTQDKVPNTLLAKACAACWCAETKEEMQERVMELLVPMLDGPDTAAAVIMAMIDRGKGWSGSHK